MIQTVNVSDFRDAFRSAGRADQFSYEGLTALFDFLEEVDPDFDLDVIALVCEYSEESVEQIADSYGLELSGDDAKDADMVETYLMNHTSLIGSTPTGFLFVNF